MSTPVLLTGTRLGNRYVVKSAASFGSGRPSYFVRDERDGTTRVVRETLLSGLDPDDRQHRRDLFLEAAHAVVGIEHPHLCPVRDVFVEGNRAYVVMDRVEGVSLSAILQMGSHGVREASVLRWGAELAEALAWLHALEPSYVLGELRPDDILVTPRDHVVLLDYGLARFFGPRPPRPALTTDPADLADDQRTLALLLDTLLLGHVPDNDDHAHPPHAATAEVLEKLTASSFPDMQEATRALHVALATVQPPLPELVDEPLPVAAAAPPRRLRPVLAAAVLLSGAALAWSLLAPPKRLEAVPERLWIVEGAETVRAVRLDGRAEGTPLRFPGSRVNEVRFFSRSQLLALTDALHPRLLLVGPEGATSACPLEAPARNLQPSADQRTLYCIEGDSVVSKVGLPAGRREQAWKLGGHLSALALSRDGRTLYASDARGGRLHAVDLAHGRVAASTPVTGGPSSIAVDPEGRALWMVLDDLGRVSIIDVRPDGTLDGSPRPVAGLQDAIADLRFTPDGRHVYALCSESRRIAVIDAATRTVVRFVDLHAWQPRGWAFSANPERAYVVAEGTSGVAIVDAETHRYEGAVQLGVTPRAVDYAR